MNKLILILSFTTAVFVACQSSHDDHDDSINTPDLSVISDLVFPQDIVEGPKGQLRITESLSTYNPEGVIPPQCYTKHDAAFNPCMTCHQSYPYKSRPNQMGDGGLQREYAFSDLGVVNHWLNLFEDRTDAMANISDQDVIDYIYTDNYTPLIKQLHETPDWQGPIPAIENLHLGKQAFDEQGFALDGSGWVAFNYKPMPSTFWPTNGSTDDVMVRLPENFRASDCDSEAFSRDTYLANLSILEASIKRLESISTPPIDENKVCTDLNGDGQLTTVENINQLSRFVGQASDIETADMIYPVGTQFLHTVRYIGITAEGEITVSPRMKEVRYMKKFQFFNISHLASMYGNEHQEKIDGLLPKYIHRGDQGTDNSFGWMVQGFIEAEDGHLRRQTQEEHLFCMGCHTTIGSTIDQTFAFPRKVTGAKGWGYINLKGMSDTPNVDGPGYGEIKHYLKTVGGGNEFRENLEMVERFFNQDGTLNEAAVDQARDVYDLITPGLRRALDLNKAYMTIVHDQDYIHGRDANLTPAKNVHPNIDNHTPVLPEDKTVPWDIRLLWPE